ncbi:molybdopterin-guanine dinucleotide biosynthesis protein MobA [Blastopirellula retiformator]|uniref:Molybdopterin-guanine dinucleotide biosynthesis protein MobA n=2 Tax=Blastopirellula retiformator TaxID=2527970 RepID=A0A5C5V2T2_9BACT|nr:molybdopterin-guanine dinucleotide biosynthesis protein MobA [Blastopirellula retiformator]
MGSDKLLLPYEGRPIIDRVIDAWREGGVDQIVVVVRADHMALRAHLQDSAIELAAVSSPLPEMVDSVRAGLRRLEEKFAPKAGDAWMLAPADLPTLDPAAIREVLAAYDPEAGETLAATYEDRRSHPVLFAWSKAQQVAALPPSGTIRDLFTENSWRGVSIAQARPRDVDVPSDLPLGEGKSEK